MIFIRSIFLSIMPLEQNSCSSLLVYVYIYIYIERINLNCYQYYTENKDTIRTKTSVRPILFYCNKFLDWGTPRIHIIPKWPPF